MEWMSPRGRNGHRPTGSYHSTAVRYSDLDFSFLKEAEI
jgi:hypothetical protein